MKLYVGNLSWSIDDKALKELFTSYGEIEEAVLIKDKFSGRSKGFGFVTFEKDEDAQKAISEMHEKEIEGRPLTVSEARPMVPRDNDRREEHSNDGPSEAPMANPSEINEAVEDETSNSDESEDDIETVEEAKEDASSDEPAAEEAEEAEETKEEAN
jgi:RNA recognition motif-containing protein